MLAVEVQRFAARFGEVIEKRRSELDQLDALAGDGDHGATMVMATRAVEIALVGCQDSDLGDALRVAALAAASVGGSSGPLWGTALLRAARSLSVDSPGPVAALLAATEAATAGVAERGRCRPGDKTMLDAMVPVCEALQESVRIGEELSQAARRAAAAASAGFTRTSDLVAIRGRARRAADRGLGHPDPGARTVALFFATLADTFPLTR